MGFPQPPALQITPTLVAQHERLIMELLPFKEPAQFHEWLSSVYVQGCWTEFSRSFLRSNPAVPEPDKAKTAQAARDAISSRTPKFLLYHPDKDGWSPEDHHVRFIVTVVTDNMLNKSLWTESDFKKRGLEITKAVFEVLSFLRARAASRDEAARMPPRYED